MFDLESGIADWRKRMLAAGIQSPATLDELESHLREEIERQLRLGMGDMQAFMAAVQEIGPAHLVQSEFGKVEPGRRIGLFTLLIVGWLAAGFMLLCGVMGFALGWDFLSFHPRWDVGTIFDALIILVTETGIWFLAGAGRSRASRVVSLLVCLFLAGWGLLVVYPEEVRGVFGSREPSPFWFRGGLTLLLWAPGIFWMRWERRYLVRERDVTRGNLPAGS